MGKRRNTNSLKQEEEHLVSFNNFSFNELRKPKVDPICCSLLYYSTLNNYIMNSAEVEFLAEKSPVTIIPNFAHNKLYLISGDVGPFQPGLPVEVPLWLGINLKQRGKCRLAPPPWMDVDSLNTKKEEERQSKVFTEMPCDNYLIVTQLLLSSGAEDIPNAQEIKTLVKDIWDLRISKLRSSVADFIRSESTHAKLDYLTLHELNHVRPFLPHALDQLSRLTSSSQLANLSTTQNLGQ